MIDEFFHSQYLVAVMKWDTYKYIYIINLFFISIHKIFKEITHMQIREFHRPASLCNLDTWQDHLLWHVAKIMCKWVTQPTVDMLHVILQKCFEPHQKSWLVLMSAVPPLLPDIWSSVHTF